MALLMFVIVSVATQWFAGPAVGRVDGAVPVIGGATD
jgi:hypothetical protein